MFGEGHEIEIEITPDGQVVSEVHGVKGPDCEGLTQWLADLGETLEDAPTDEYYEQSVGLGDQQKIGGGW